MALFSTVYDWLFNFFFSGSLPESLSSISIELTTILTIIFCSALIFIPFYVVFRLVKFILDLTSR